MDDGRERERERKREKNALAATVENQRGILFCLYQSFYLLFNKETSKYEKLIVFV